MSLKTAIVLTIMVLAGALGDVLVSKGMKQVGEIDSAQPAALLRAGIRAAHNPYVVSGVVSLAVYFFSFSTVLSWADVSLVVPISALSFLLTTFVAQRALGEHVTLQRWCGTVLIVIGVVLVARSQAASRTSGARRQAPVSARLNLEPRRYGRTQGGGPRDDLPGRRLMAERSSLAFLRGALVAATAASIGYQIAAMLAARRWRRRSTAAVEGNEAPLPVSLLKPVRGPEPHAEPSFVSFGLQDHPEYELLFGVADPDDPVVELIRRLAGRYPAAHVRLIQTSADLGPNRKVCNLHGLAAAARYDLLLVSDSDMRVPPDYLRRIVAPFRDPRVGLVTCPYRGAEPQGVPAALEALGIAASFMPGVFVAALGGSAFAFGSTIALRRETLERIGGFPGLVHYLADDYQMGRRVVELGLHVHLSSVVVDSVLGRRSFPETWSRRLRWARTVRACRPLGHLGSALTHTTALALLTAAVFAATGPNRECENAKGRGDAEGLRETMKKTPRGRGGSPAPTPSPSPNTGGGERAPGSGSGSPSPSIGGGGQGVGAGLQTMEPVRALVAAALLVRFVAAWRIAVVELESDAARRWFPLLPISDLVEAALWLTSRFGRTVLWRGQRYRLLKGGRIERLDSDQ